MKLRFIHPFPAMKKRLARILLGLILTSIFILQAASIVSIPLLDRLDGIFYDSKVRLNAENTVDPRIVIVDIDEKSLQEREKGGEGRWPWPRNRLALLVNRLFHDYEVAVAGFDVVFSERDESSGIRAIDELARKQLKDNANFQAQYPSIKSALNYDGQFAQAMKDKATILGFSFLSPGDSTKKGELPATELTTKEIPITLVRPLQRDGYTANLSLLQSSAADGGHINPIVDPDGIIRRIPMLVEHENRYYESLGLAVARNLLGSLPIKPIFNGNSNAPGDLEILDVGGALLPIDSHLASFVPYRGPYKSFEYLSASDVLNKSIPKHKLEGKIVLVGTTAPGLLDLRATPMGNLFPGVEIHANVIAGILDGTIKQAPLWTHAANLLLVTLLGFGLALLLPFLSPLWSSITAILVIGGVITLNLYSFTAGYVLPAASLLSALTFIYLMNIAYGYFIESRGKRQITGLFGQYVPPELVEEMAQDPAGFSMEGESRELTILFSDVRGFTTISENLDAKTLSEFINAFLTPFTKVIYKNRGTIDKYMGDCIMAFWGAPIKDKDHARHGLISAFEMLKAMEALNEEFKQRGWPPIKVGIGLNSGKVNVGNMGSEIRLAYTVMGDAVNLASRLEGITKEYGAAIIIGEETRKQMPDLIAREVDKVRVKGKDIAVTIYEPLGFEGQVNAAALTVLPQFENALKAYREQDWEEAENRFKNLLQNHRDTGEVLYELYLERIQFLRDNPPGDQWDGAFTFTKK
jgi:adenylate cyclase